MNAVVSISAAPARSIVEERAMRPPVIGRIRPGIKVLTSTARKNDRAVKLYDELVAAGESFETIGAEIERRCNLKNPLAPRNVPYFVCRRSDFNNQDVADEILRLYGEDRGEGVKLYRFPVKFAFNDWMANLPNEMATWGTNGRKFFSEYGPDGTRYCKAYAKAERDPRAQRASRNFGPRVALLREDNAIPDGVCNPEVCPQYQARQCNLSARFIFAVPEIRGLGLIELPTNSIYVLQKAYAAMQTVLLARGRLTGTRFWLSKREFEITRINEQGEAVRQAQMLTVLDAEIDISALLDGADEHPPALQDASNAAMLLEGTGNVHLLQPAGPVGSDGESPSSFDVTQQLQQGSVSPDTGPLMQAGQPEPESGNGTTGPLESLEDKHGRMSDLLKRLGLSAENRQKDFRVFGHTLFGRGWIQRSSDVDSMNARLTAALDDRDALEREIAKAVQDAMSV